MKIVPEKPSLERILLAEQLKFYRLQRHDFLNHWQVIMGYLQLNKVDKALLYMQEGIAGLETEQLIGQIPQEIVVSILLGFVIPLRTEGILVELELENNLKKEDFWREFWQEEYGELLYGYTKECLATILELYKGLEIAIVELKLKAGEDFCSISLLDDDTLIWSGSLKF